MPEQYNPKRRPYPLSNLHDRLDLIRVRCTYCKRTHNYFPADLIQIFGDVDIDSLADQMKCEGCKSRAVIEVKTFVPSAAEAVGLRIRRLVAIKIQHVPVWRED